MPPTQHSSDHFWMQQALRLADHMRGHVWPNPPVGCIIVKDGVAVAKAATGAGGRPHAERKALDQIGMKAKGTTLYVTLEPCCHWGKTPPCADAIIKAGVSRVVCAIQDPDPRVNGGGFAKLRTAGVEVVTGIGADDARRLMSGFFHRVQYDEPELVVLKEVTGAIPDGIDALIQSSDNGPRLLTRTGEIDIQETSFHQLLPKMGTHGLTSVAIARCDPLYAALRTVQKGQSPTTTILKHANRSSMVGNLP